ncbi:hypothetical protein [Undibacterium sp.]|uniref:hypothetical protein n=1 Tax=Undibacterium sp. TaxID=1914977 RepID=UPI00374D6692
MIDTDILSVQDTELKDLPSPRAKPASAPQGKTGLHDNPFFLLGASQRDTRQRIVELADEKSLLLDHDVCQTARADLTTPRRRLSAEIAWLPGVAEEKISHLLENLLAAPKSVAKQTDLPPLAHANLMAAVCEVESIVFLEQGFVQYIQDISYLVERVVAEDAMRLINEARQASGFTEVRSADHVDEEILNRKLHFLTVIKQALNRFPASSLIHIIASVVSAATKDGTQHAPTLIEQLVDGYEIECQDFLNKESDNIQALIPVISKIAVKGSDAIEPLLAQLERMARKWHKVIRPIQLSAVSRGMDDERTKSIAYALLGLAVELFNEHGLLEPAQQITRIVEELFSEVSGMSGRLKRDIETLAQIESDRKSRDGKAGHGGKLAYFSAGVGLVFKDRLRIEAGKIIWKESEYELDEITGIRWDTNDRVAGELLPRTHYIGFCDEWSEVFIVLRRKKTYVDFIDVLWGAVASRMLDNFLNALKQGKQIQFGRVLVKDEGVVLLKHGLAMKDKAMFLPWRQVITWKANGFYYIASEDDKRVNERLSYRDMLNVRLLDFAITMAQDVAGIKKLSELLS